MPLTALMNLFEGIGQSATSGAETSTQSILGFLGATWNQSVSSFARYGVLAPVIASAIWGVSIIILIFFVFKAIQLAIRETEED